MPSSSKHANDVTFTEDSLVGFIKKIHNNIGDNYHFVSTSDMAEKRAGNANYVFTGYEKEIEDAFPASNNTVGWNKGNIAKICIINNEFPKGATLNSDANRNSGRYTWVRGGSLLKFETEIAGKTKDNRPNGTIWIDENNGTTLHAVKVKGFDDSGNFDNSNANPAKSANGTASIGSDIIYAYKSLGSTSYPVPTAYITNLGTEGKPVDKAYIKNLYITDGGNISTSGVIAITDDTDATRTASANVYEPVTVSDDNFNLGGTITFKGTNNTYYINKSGTLAVVGTVYNWPTQKFYTRSSGSGGYGGGGWSDGGGAVVGGGSSGTYTYAEVAATDIPLTACNRTNDLKFFKSASTAKQYYVSNGSGGYTHCTTTTYPHPRNQQFYIYWSKNDPALGIPYGGTVTVNLTGSITTRGGIAAGKTIKGYRIHAAVFNDYAEYRQTDSQEPGRCVIEVGDGNMTLSSKRLQPGANIVSDTFGFSIGETYLAQTPIAVCGRVLAYPLEDKQIYEPGDAVCSGPNGTISKMTREEIKEWPDRIVGYISEIPNYEVWGSDQVKVNGRIWIKIK